MRALLRSDQYRSFGRARKILIILLAHPKLKQHLSAGGNDEGKINVVDFAGLATINQASDNERH